MRGGYPNGNYTNCITLAPKYAAISEFKVNDNWLEGGDVLLQIVAQRTGYDAGNDGAIARNRCGADQKPLSSGRYMQMRAPTGLGTYSGLHSNVFDHLPSVPSALRGKPLVPKGGSNTGPTDFDYSIMK